MLIPQDIHRVTSRLLKRTARFVCVLSLAAHGLYAISLPSISQASTGGIVADAPGVAAAVEAPGFFEGTVLGPDGKPVEGALVAAVSETLGTNEAMTRPVAQVRTNKKGQFRLDKLPAGPYAITATAKGLVATLRGKLVVSSAQGMGQGQKDITLHMALPAEKTGATFSGVILGKDKKPIPSAQLRLIRYSDELGDVFFVEPDRQGRYEVTLPPATYLLNVVAAGYQSEIRELEANQDRQQDFHLNRGPSDQRAPQPVVDWIRQTAIPLSTPEAGHGFEDMQHLKPMIGDARVVALGEATHGTREFFQMKHRMLEYLVETQGFTVFGIEATMPEGFDVNDYVLTGRGDPKKALESLYFWTWNTEEVLEMIEWMRQYNANPKHLRKVKFYGFDMQSAVRAARVVHDYFQDVEPHAVPELEKALAPVSTALAEIRFLALPPEQKTPVLKAAQALLQRLDAQKSAYISRSSAERFALARQHARVLTQYLELYADGVSGQASRDRAMAENVQWILEHEGPDARMVLWAHNFHVSTASKFGMEPMGVYLRKALGKDMVVFGFNFHQGSFQAVDMTPGPNRGLRTFTVPPAPEASLDATLARAGHPLAVLDLRTLPAKGAVTDWFEAMHVTRDLGAVYSEANPSAALQSQYVAELYDALIFVEKTSDARPVGGRKAKETPQPSPLNLDFEQGDSDAIPLGWREVGQNKASGHRFTRSTQAARQGRYGGELRRISDMRYGELLGTVYQRLDATPFRNQRVKLTAWARAEKEGWGSEASLWLNVPKEGGDGTSAFSQYRAKTSVSGSSWQAYELEIQVPADADQLLLGASVAGDLTLFLDDVSIVPVVPEATGRAEVR